MRFQKTPSRSVTGGLESGRLGGRTRAPGFVMADVIEGGIGAPWFGGSFEHYRKFYTMSARVSMDRINGQYSRFLDAMRGLTVQAVREALELPFELSQEYCPVDTGALISSGQLKVRREGRGRVRGTINYGGPQAPYAAIVHERTDLNHKHPTRAKFLQSAMEETLGTFIDVIEQEYKKLFKT